MQRSKDLSQRVEIAPFCSKLTYGLQRRMAAVFGTLIGGFVVTMIILNLQLQLDLVQKRADQRIDHLSKLVLEISLPFLIEGRTSKLDIIYEDLQDQDDVTSLVFIDSDNMLLVTGSDEGTQYFLTEIEHPLIDQALESKQIQRRTMGQTEEVAVPVSLGNQYFGTIRFDLDTTVLYSDVQLVWTRNALAGLFFTLSGVFLSWMVSRRLTFPLQRLTEASRRAASGDLDQAIVIKTNDELESLADSFNTMLGTMRTRLHMLEETQFDLEAASGDLNETNYQLSEALDKARSADQAKSEFLASMSHEIRTPMNGVLGMAELLSESRLDRNQRGLLDTIQSSGRSLLNIINEILDYSKIESGHLKIRTEPFQVCEIIDDPARLLAMQASKTQVDFITRVDPDLPATLIGDFQRLRQVVINLGSNALKFTKTGFVMMDLKLVSEAGDRTIVQIDVQDTGCGIPEDNLAEVFEQFTQVDSSFTRPHEGTGLGLAISKGLVELMGGSIWATSEAGKGSTFSFRVPLSSKGLAPETKGMRPECETRGKSVLIVDQNEKRCRAWAELFASWGMRVSQSDTLSHAFEMPGLVDAQDADTLIYCSDHALAQATPPEIAKLSNSVNNGAKIFLTSPFGAPVAPVKGVLADKVVRATLPMGLAQIIKDIEDALGEPSQSAPTSKTSQPGPALPAADPGYLPVGTDDTVLIVDDNKTNLKLVQLIVRKLGVKQVSAQNGKEAVSAYEKHRPKLVLMDVSMPVMNGLDATREIRELEQHLETPASIIIGLTAHTMESDRKACFDHGMNDHMAKPVSVAALRQLVQKNISIHQPPAMGP